MVSNRSGAGILEKGAGLGPTVATVHGGAVRGRRGLRDFGGIHEDTVEGVYGVLGWAVH